MRKILLLLAVFGLMAAPAAAETIKMDFGVTLGAADTDSNRIVATRQAAGQSLVVGRRQGFGCQRF